MKYKIGDVVTSVYSFGRITGIIVDIDKDDMNFFLPYLVLEPDNTITWASDRDICLK